MMYLNQLMRSQRLTKAELSRQSGIPETTLRDLLSGSVRLENCKAGTILRLARAFHVSVEELLCTAANTLRIIRSIVRSPCRRTSRRRSARCFMPSRSCCPIPDDRADGGLHRTACTAGMPALPAGILHGNGRALPPDRAGRTQLPSRKPRLRLFC